MLASVNDSSSTLNNKLWKVRSEKTFVCKSPTNNLKSYFNGNLKS